MSGHVRCPQVAYTHVEVLLQTLRMQRFRDYGRAPLNTPTQEHLCARHPRAMCLRDFLDYRVVDELGFSEGRVCSDQHASFGTERQQVVLREAGMQFHLVHRGHDVCVFEKLGERLDAEVGDPNRLRFP